MRCSSIALRTSSMRFEALFAALPSTPMATVAPACRRSGTRQHPAAVYMFEFGQCAMPVWVRPTRATSLSLRQVACAYHTSGPTQPHSSAISTDEWP